MKIYINMKAATLPFSQEKRVEGNEPGLFIKFYDA